MDHPDRVEKLFGRGVLEHEAARPGAQRGVDVLLEIERGEHQHPGGLWHRRDRRGCLDAVDAGHPHVHQHHVGPAPLGQLDGLAAVGGIADHVELGVALDDHPETGTNHGLVIDEHHADHRARSAGSTLDA